MMDLPNYEVNVRVYLKASTEEANRYINFLSETIKMATDHYNRIKEVKYYGLKASTKKLSLPTYNDLPQGEPNAIHRNHTNGPRDARIPRKQHGRDSRRTSKSPVR